MPPQMQTTDALNAVELEDSSEDFEEISDFINSMLHQLGDTELFCAAVLAELSIQRYKAVIVNVLQFDLNEYEFPEFFSPNKVAIYGGLCALATFDKDELQKKVISSSSFNLFLDLEPQMKEIIFKFNESKYGSCLKLLDEIKDNLLCDRHLGPHINILYAQIRKRALIEYCRPHLSVDMYKIATEFSTTVPALEDELTQLILDGQIQARIDSNRKILVTNRENKRISSQLGKILLMIVEFGRRFITLILRPAFLRSKIFVEDHHGETSSQSE